MTLAYQFDITEYDSLKSLVGELELPEESNWELRLYSKDPRFANYQVKLPTIINQQIVLTARIFLPTIKAQKNMGNNIDNSSTLTILFFLGKVIKNL